MESNVYLLVILAAVLHSAWNGMVKKHKDKVVSVSAIVFGHVPIAIGVMFFVPLPTLESVPYIILSAIIHQGYQWYLLNSYQLGDLTKVYPIARGFGPLVATVISILFLGLVISDLAILSILLISFGIMLVGIFDHNNFKNIKVLKYSLLTGFFIGSYSIVDGYGARVSLSAITYMSWSFMLGAIMFFVLLKIKKYDNTFKNVVKNGKKIFFIGGSLSYLIYIIVVWGFTKAPIPMVAALRESSIFFSIFIGYFFLKEKITPIKITSIVLILVGVISLKLV